MSSNPEFSEETEQKQLAVVEQITLAEDNYYSGFPSFEDLSGLDNEIAQLKQSYVLAQNPRLCEEWDIDSTKGIILCGPGGVGKTAMVRALAKETQSLLHTVLPSEILTKWVGEPAHKLSEVFSDAEECPHPVILFFDEFDGLFGEDAGGNSGVHRTLVSEMKGLMNDVSANVLVIAATNSIQGFDPALLRSGRFDKVIQVPLPDSRARAVILFDMTYKNSELYDMNNLNCAELSEHTEGMSGADIANILKAARTKRVLSHLNDGEDLEQVNHSDILKSINHHRTSRPSQ